MFNKSQSSIWLLLWSEVPLPSCILAFTTLVTLEHFLRYYWRDLHVVKTLRQYLNNMYTKHTSRSYWQDEYSVATGQTTTSLANPEMILIFKRLST